MSHQTESLITHYQQKLHQLQQEIAVELQLCGRAADHITLVGISKKQDLINVQAAIQAGLTDIGENYVQEAKAKLPLLPLVCKHFTGHIQTNKARLIVELFDMVQSVDRFAAAIALNKAAQAMDKRLPVLLQLNISPAERFGCALEEAPRLAEQIRALSHLQLQGVMAIGPLNARPEQQAAAFAQAAAVFKAIGGRVLSLGMSDDWRLAVRAGSTMVRIGTALFGRRA